MTKDTKRVPVVEAVLDPLSRADQPGGIARGRTQRRVLLETLFNIAEERGAIQSESVQRDGREITMCWLVDDHPLVVYARQPAAAIAHLFNFVSTTRAHGDRADWVNAALFAELLSRVEGDALESNIRSAVERGIMKPEDHGKKAGFVVNRDQPEVRTVLGEFGGLNGDAVERVMTATATAPDADDDDGRRGARDDARDHAVYDGGGRDDRALTPPPWHANAPGAVRAADAGAAGAGERRRQPRERERKPRTDGAHPHRRRRRGQHGPRAPHRAARTARAHHDDGRRDRIRGRAGDTPGADPPGSAHPASRWVHIRARGPQGAVGQGPAHGRGVRVGDATGSRARYRSGCDGFLAKPYYPEQLRAVIDQYLPTHAKRTHKER